MRKVITLFATIQSGIDIKRIASSADVAEPSQHAHFDLARFKAELNRLNLSLIG